MELSKMTDKNLDKHIKLLEGALRVTRDSRNSMLYIKWINQAKAERERRTNKRDTTKGVRVFG